MASRRGKKPKRPGTPPGGGDRRAAPSRQPGSATRERTRERGAERADARPAAAAADRWRPWLLAGTTALLVARPLWPSESAAAEGDGLPTIMLWLALATLWMLGAIGRPRLALRFGPVDAAVLLLIVWHTIAGVHAAAVATPRPAVNMLWEWIGLGVGFLLVRQLVATRREARALAAVMISLGVALAAYGLYQVFYELPATLKVYQSDPEAALRAAGLRLEDGPAGRELFARRLETIEPLATFALTNSLAGYLAAWLVVAAGAAIVSFRKWRPRAWQWTGLVLAAAVVVTCLAMTHSRSGLVAVAAGLVLAVVFCRGTGGGRRRRTVALAGVAVIVLAVALGGALVATAASAVGESNVNGSAGGRAATDNRLVAAAAKSLSYRLQYWRSSARMIADHPWLGCGPGNFQNAYMAYKLPTAGEEVADPHNFVLEVWATAGTPAALALLGALGLFAWVALVRGGEEPPGSPAADAGRQAAVAGEGAAPPDRAGHVVGGAAAGVVAAPLLGAVSVAPPGPMALVIVMPAAALALASLWPWVARGRITATVPGVGLLALAIHLLASGGIGYPGLAGSFWLLAALGLNLAGQDAGAAVGRPAAQAPEPRLTLSWRAAAAGLGTGLLLVAGCYATAYNPVLTSGGRMEAADQALRRGDLGAARARLKAAAVADPLAAGPWRDLAALEVYAWQGPPSRAAWQRFQALVEGMLARAPNSAAFWLQAGDGYLEAAAEAAAEASAPADAASIHQASLGKAVAAYRRAVKLYPNSARCRARLAEAALAAGHRAEFRRQAAEALRLDRATPHANQKLAPETHAALQERLPPAAGTGGD